MRLLQAKKGGGFEDLDTHALLEFRRRGFDGEDSTRLEMRGGGNGDVVDTSKAKEVEKRRYDRLVFVNVLSRGGDKVRARIPIPLIDDRVITVPVQAEDENINEALEGYLSLSRNTLSAAQVLADLVTEINALLAKPDKRAEALARVRTALQRSRDDHRRLTSDRAEVEKELEKLPQKDRPSLKAVDERLKLLASKGKELQDRVEALEKLEREEKDPEKKKARFDLEAAKGHEKAADVDQALAIYKAVPQKFRPEDLDKHVEKLEKQWKTADDDHAAARRFVYKIYPTMKPEQIDKEWATLEGHVKKLKAVKDRWGLLKVALVTARHRDQAATQAENLKPQLNPEEEAPAKLLASLLPKLDALVKEASAWVDDLKD
jgi:hypothetical protein